MFLIILRISVLNVLKNVLCFRIEYILELVFSIHKSQPKAKDVQV